MTTKTFVIAVTLTLLSCQLNRLLQANNTTNGVDLGLCPPKIIQCPCGEKQSLFHTTVKQCTFFEGKEWYCKSCEDEDDKQVCSKFRHCYACDSDHNWRCQLCPIGRSGIWCDQDFVEEGCQPLLAPDNVIIKPSFQEGNVPRGTVVTYTCVKGHFLVAGSARRTCRQDDTWSGVDAICVSNTDGGITACPPFSTPPHSTHTVLNGGTGVRYACHDNFTLTGNELIECVNGAWSSHPPQCEKKNETKTCPPVSAVSGASVSVVLKGVLPSTFIRSEVEAANSPLGPFQEGTQLLYTCSTKFFKLFGSTIRTCSDGQWSGRAPICVPVCGRSSNPAVPFVTDGSPSNVGQWPWVVAIRVRLDNNQWSFQCGGSLISDRWVLTAAHCVTIWKTNVKIPLDQLKLYFGKHFQDDLKDDDEVQIREPKAIHVHPDYDVTSLDSDIALIKISPSVQLTSRVQSICLPDPEISVSNLHEGNLGTVIGWGHNENATIAPVLSYAKLPVVSLSKCRTEYRKKGIKVTDNMICAGYDEGVKDVCKGDSGGPLVFPKDIGNQWWIIEGVVSWGGPGNCGDPRQYSGFVRVSNFVEWINLFLFQ